MGKKSAPPPPDYQALAAQQGQENRNTAQYNAELNRVNQITPYGSLTWKQNVGPGQPGWTQTMTLSDSQQALQNQQDALSQKYLATAGSAADRVAAAMGQQFDTSKIPDQQYVSGSGATSAQAGLPYQSVGTGPQFQGVQNSPDLQTDLGHYAKIQEAPQMQGASGGQIQRDFDTSGVRKLPGNIDDTSRRRVEEAIMSRLNPQYQQDEQALRTRLANSGITVGSDAYNKEMNNFSQRLNDARMQAVLSGGQEESRQVGLQQGLQGQEFNQAYQKGQFGQNADIAQGAQNLQAAQINNQAALGRYQAQLAAQGQDFNQQLAAGNFRNNAYTQGLANDMSAAGFNNQAGQQGFQNQVTGATFANNAADVAAQRQLQIDQYNNAAQMQRAGFNNQAAQADLQRQAYLRQIPLNEANALRTGAQVQGPQFQQYYTTSAQGAPIFDAGVAQGNYNAQVGAQNQAGMNALLGGLANMGSAYFMGSSDPRLKTNIVKVGDHPMGLPIYEYDIKGRRERGFMSNDVRKIAPNAVIVGPDGFDMVDYGQLGGRP